MFLSDDDDDFGGTFEAELADMDYDDDDFNNVTHITEEVSDSFSENSISFPKFFLLANFRVSCFRSFENAESEKA